MLKHLLGAAIAAVLALSSAQAAEIELRPKKCDDAQFTNCGMVLVYGDIVEGDDVKFARVTDGLQAAVVVLNSAGGEFKVGINIARRIKKYGWNTGAHKLCASVCAVMWLSGEQRFYLRESRIGFHGVYRQLIDKRTGRPISNHVSSGGSALLGAYLSELGLSAEAIEAFAAPGPNEMYWLETKKLKQLGITAERID